MQELLAFSDYRSPQQSQVRPEQNRQIKKVKMRENITHNDCDKWPQRPVEFPQLMTPIEAAMFLRLDQTGHDPESACRTLCYWRDKGELNATKYAKRVWYLKTELEKFLINKTEK